MRLLTLIVTLLALETGLWVAETRLGFHHFSLLRHSWYENFYFHHTPPNSADVSPPKNFDRQFGWRNVPTSDPEQTISETANSENWRAPFEYAEKKQMPRIALFGDSFMFGTRLADEETVAAKLRLRLGRQYEVLDFSARGYGLDQMALVAEHAVRRYAPDIIVVGFIAADLERSCFNFNFNARKPRFELEKGDLHLTGVPVASPAETAIEHQSRLARWEDFAFTQILRSRIACGIGQVVLMPSYQRCLEGLNSALAKKIIALMPGPKQVYFFHLDFPLPRKFEHQLIATGANYISLPARGVDGERFPDRHPKAQLAERFADEMFDALRFPHL